MSATELNATIALSALLLLIGFAGLILRRNPLIALMGIELMLNASNLAFIAFARWWGNTVGHIFAFLVITVAAAEASIALAIVVVVFHARLQTDLDDVSGLKG